MPDQRKHLRLPLATTTFIELPSSRVGQLQSGRMIKCNTLNISRGGLQVILAEKLTVGAILKIGVVLPSMTDTLCVSGEVRWCLRSNDEQHPWMAGFQILNANDTDIDDWIAMIAAMER